MNTWGLAKCLSFRGGAGDLLVDFLFDKTITDVWDVSYSYRIHTSNILKCIDWTYSQCITRWWFQLYFLLFIPIGGNDAIWLAHLFQMGWFNHQPDHPPKRVWDEKDSSLKWPGKPWHIENIHNESQLFIYVMSWSFMNHCRSTALFGSSTTPWIGVLLVTLELLIPWSCRRRSKGHYINCYLICVNLFGAT